MLLIYFLIQLYLLARVEEEEEGRESDKESDKDTHMYILG